MLAIPDDCDFLDLGSGFGGCIDFAKKKLGGKRGVGIEIHKQRFLDLVAGGYPCVHGDITKIKFPKECVNFVTMSHVLEHLTNIEEAKHVVLSAIRAAKHFVFIEGPSFDFDQYLARFNLKFSWRDGHGHYTKVKVLDVLDWIKLSQCAGFTLQIEYPLISSSDSKDLHPLSSPSSVGDYNFKKHPQKKRINLPKQVYRSFIVYAWKRKFDTSKLERSRAPKFRNAKKLWLK